MKMRYKTKVQITSGSLRTTIPKFLTDFIGLEPGDQIEWTIDTKTEEITIKKLKD